MGQRTGKRLIVVDSFISIGLLIALVSSSGIAHDADQPDELTYAPDNYSDSVGVMDGGVNPKPDVAWEDSEYSKFLPVIQNQLPPIIPETTEILTQQSTSTITSISADGSTFTFSALTPELEQVDVGDLIISGISDAASEGFLRKVTSKQNLGHGLKLITEQGTLEEAFERVSVDIQQVLTPQNMKSFQTIPGVKFIQPSIVSNSSDFQFQLDSAVLYDEDNNLTTTDDQVIADGLLTFQPRIQFHIELIDFHLEELYFSQIMSAQTELTLSSKIGLTIPIHEVPLTPPVYLAAIPVPGLPLVITPALQVWTGINGTVYAGVSSSVTQTTSFTSGFYYSNDTWQLIRNFSNEFTYNQPHFTYGVSFKAYVGPKLSLRINGVAGPYVKVNLALKLEIDPAPNPRFTLKGGLEIPIGVSMEIFSHVLIDFQAIAIDYWRLLYSQTCTHLGSVCKLI
jgi:hypothetical protein